MQLWTTETVQVLLEHSANVDALGATQSTPLHLASSIKSPEIVWQLIKHGADVNARDWKRRTPLHLALVKVSVNNWQVL
jgi:ankyrin repeat protein